MMKKQTFITLVLGVIGGLLLSLGLCMCLVPEWNSFSIGVIVTALGTVILLRLVLMLWKKHDRKVHIQWKLAGKILYGIVAALVLGVGMCMILVWQMMLPGIFVGVLGIVLLLGLIPLCLGLK